MTQWLLNNLAPFVNSIGLGFDIVGAGLVAYEAVRQFRGLRVRVGMGVVVSGFAVGGKAKETPEYAKWEQQKYLAMKWGLGFIVVGFVLQMISNWL